VQVLGNAVNRVDIHQGHDGALLDTGEEGNLATLTEVNFHFGATQQHIGLQADGAQLFHRVLGRLGLGFTGSGDIGHQGEVKQQGAG